MVLKLIDATQVRVGTIIMIDNVPCTVKSIDISKTGKHGHAKARIEAVEIFAGRKKGGVFKKVYLHFFQGRKQEPFEIEEKDSRVH